MSAEQAATATPSNQGPPLFWRLWLAGLVLFLLLAGLAVFYDYFPSDQRIANAVQGIDVPALGGAFGFTNQAGDTLWASASWGIVIAGLALLTRWRDAAYLFLAIVPRGVNPLVKVIVDRPRPSPTLVHIGEDASGSGFPSGHVTSALTFYVLLFVIAFFAIRQPALRAALQGFCLFMVVVVGPGRVYSGAHWPSDVLGGYLLSALFLAPVLRWYWSGREPGAGPVLNWSRITPKLGLR